MAKYARKRRDDFEARIRPSEYDYLYWVRPVLAWGLGVLSGGGVVGVLWWLASLH